MRTKTASLMSVLVSAMFALPCCAQQIADPDFDTTVARPAYLNKHPAVLFDEGHANFHTSTGRYKAFADLMRSDGYKVVPNKDKFSKSTLKGYAVLVISNALGAGTVNEEEWSKAWIEAGAQPAFTEGECDVVRDWVHAGGSLLLVADHRPFGSAAENLARKFGVDMSKGYAFDEANSYKEMKNPGIIVYTRENKTIADHAITRGRDTTEQINRVILFVGQSLKGPANAAAFLKLAPTAIDRESLLSSAKEVPAGNRAQGVAMEFGKGRAVVLGEAAMLSAQLGVSPNRTIKFGMNVPGIDNRQLALNIMHWLSRLLQ